MLVTHLGIQILSQSHHNSWYLLLCKRERRNFCFTVNTSIFFLKNVSIYSSTQKKWSKSSADQITLFITLFPANAVVFTVSPDSLLPPALITWLAVTPTASLVLDIFSMYLHRSLLFTYSRIEHTVLHCLGCWVFSHCGHHWDHHWDHHSLRPLGPRTLEMFDQYLLVNE